MKLPRFMIEFSNATATYYAGQEINGVVSIVLNEPLKMRGIRLNFNGRAYVKWSERIGEHTHTHSDQENYINSDVTIWGNEPKSSNENPTMQPGAYELPFTFAIPPNCPSSFEGEHGSIRYICTATVDLPMKIDQTAMAALTVIALVDLNFIPNVSVPLTDEKSKSLGCCCCMSGTISCSMKIPRSGFVPGETLPIQMQVVNSSDVRVDEVNVFVEEQVEFYADGNVKSHIRVVTQVKKGMIEPGKTQIWKNEGIKLPPVAPTLLNCRIIKINYFLNFDVDPSGMHTDLSFRIPIYIGNIPLRVVMQQLNQIYGNSNLNPISDDPNVPPPPPAAPIAGGSYPDLPPPVYEEHVYGLTDIREEENNEENAEYGVESAPNNFAPRYTYYDWSQKESTYM